MQKPKPMHYTIIRYYKAKVSLHTTSTTQVWASELAFITAHTQNACWVSFQYGAGCSQRYFFFFFTCFRRSKYCKFPFVYTNKIHQYLSIILKMTSKEFDKEQLVTKRHLQYVDTLILTDQSKPTANEWYIWNKTIEIFGSPNYFPGRNQ